MKTRIIHAFASSFVVVVLLLVGLFAPGWGHAEEPAPSHRATPDGVAPVYVAEQLLAPPDPPTGCSSTTHALGASGGLPIPDQGVITATMPVAATGYLWHISLDATITHTFPADLEMFLISPAGTEVTLSTDNGSGNDNVFAGTTWSDQWVGASVSDYVYANNVPVPTMSPEEALSAFKGEDPQGDWKLVIRDDAGNDVGTLGAWYLTLEVLSVAPQSDLYDDWSFPNAAIPDNGTYTAQLDFPTPLTIHDLNLETRITHPANNELDIYLVSPDGITVTVSTDNGGALADGFSYTTWDDAAGAANPPGPVTDNGFVNNLEEDPLVIENALAAFDGLDSGGTWTLVVKDDTPGNTGTLEAWNIKVDQQHCLMDLEAGVNAYGYYPTELGEPVEFDIYAANYGAIPAANVLFTDTLPAGAAFLSWTTPDGWSCTAPPIGGTGQVTCNTASLAPGASGIFHLQLAPLSAPQWLMNQAAVSASGPEYTLGNNFDFAYNYTGLVSANGNPWDVLDGLVERVELPEDTGGMAFGGQVAFYTGYGMLRLRVLDAANTILTDNEELSGFGLTFDGSRGWTTTTPPAFSDIAVSRTVAAPADADYVRYLDSFTNTGSEVRQVQVAWGGYLGSLFDTTLAATSSGDLVLDTDDTWAVTIDNPSNNPAGPTENPPVGVLLRGAGDPTYVRPGDYGNNPFQTPWGGDGYYYMSHVFAFTLQPGETAHLVYFLYRGLAEERPGPEGCTVDCVTPPAGSEIALAQTTLTALAAAPDVCDLPQSVLANVLNWPGVAASCPIYPVYLPVIVR